MGKALIEYNGHVFYFEKPKHMTQKMFLDRCWFVVKNQNEKNIDSIANLWVASRYYNTGYSKEMMEAIERCVKKLGVS